MSIEDFLHPLWKRSLELDKNNLNTTVLREIQKPLSQAEQDIIASRIQLSVDTATSYWLDYWGSWLGLHRINGWTDDEYREHLKHHVLHPRNTISALQQAVADFLNTDKANIHIYEPFRDMLIWNKSNYNSFAYFPSTYYRYAVIDVQIDAPYDKTVAEIINLFRPAGVIWVITSKINSFSDEAPIIPMGIRNARYPFLSYDTNYAGFESRDTGRIVPSLDNTLTVDDPFIYNDNESLLNEGKKYAGGNSSHNNVASVGQLVRSYTPLKTDEFGDTRAYVEQLIHQDRVAVSTRDNNAKTFTLSPAKLNLVQGTTGNSINYNLYTDTKDFNNSDTWYAYSAWVKEADKYNGLTVIHNTGSWSGISQYIPVKKGETYTFSMYARYVSGTGNSNIYWILNNNPEGNYNAANASPGTRIVALTDSWQRVSSTVTILTDGYIRPRIERATDNTNTLQIAGIKVEKGSVATDWCPAESEITDPEYFHKQTLMGGAPNTIPYETEENLLTGTADKILTGSGSRVSGYLSNETENDFLSLLQGLEGETVTFSFDYEYHGFVKGSGYNRMGWEIGIIADSTSWVSAWHSPKNDSGSGRTSSTFVVPKNITGIREGRGFIQFSGSGTGTLSHLKLEKGGVATPWTPNIKDSLVNSLAYKGYLLDASLKTNTTYDIGLTGYSSTTFAQSNVKFYINGNTPISAVLKSSLDNKSTWYTASFTTPEDFVSDRIIAISLEGIDSAPDFTYSNLVIREHDNTKPLYYSMNKNDTQKDYGLTGIYDVKGFINTYKTPLDSNATNQTINDMFASKNMMFTVKSLATTNDVNVKIQMYNFKINMWVTQDTQVVTKDYKDIMLKINDITPYLNDNGVLFYQVIPETKNYLVVNYLGLSVTKRSDTPDTSYLVNQDGCGAEIPEAPNTIGSAVIGESELA